MAPRRLHHVRGRRVAGTIPIDFLRQPRVLLHQFQNRHRQNTHLKDNQLLNQMEFRRSMRAMTTDVSPFRFGHDHPLTSGDVFF